MLGDLVHRPAPPGAVVAGGLAAAVPRDLADLDADERRRAARGGGPADRGAPVLRRDPGRSPRRSAPATPTRSTCWPWSSGADELVESSTGRRRPGRAAASTSWTRGAALHDGGARRRRARRALAALDRHRLLCAHREGPYGVRALERRRSRRWLARRGATGYAADGRWYVGRPLLVTANDYEMRLFNGDTGVVVAATGRRSAGGVPRGTARRPARRSSRLAAVQTVHAMTVHRSQGSQFDRVTLVLPPAESPLLTRELALHRGHPRQGARAGHRLARGAGGRRRAADRAGQRPARARHLRPVSAAGRPRRGRRRRRPARARW